MLRNCINKKVARPISPIRRLRALTVLSTMLRNMISTLVFGMWYFVGTKFEDNNLLIGYSAFRVWALWGLVIFLKVLLFMGLHVLNTSTKCEVHTAFLSKVRHPMSALCSLMMLNGNMSYNCYEQSVYQIWTLCQKGSNKKLLTCCFNFFTVHRNVSILFVYNMKVPPKCCTIFGI